MLVFSRASLELVTKADILAAHVSIGESRATKEEANGFSFFVFSLSFLFQARMGERVLVTDR